MTKQKGNPKRSVAFATALMLVSLAAFGAAFYFLDGMALVEEYLGTGDGGSATGTGSSEATESAGRVSEDTLQLPAGMPEEFALRIWQEQVDSQANLSRLADGEVEHIKVSGTDLQEDVSTLSITASFRDGTSADGKLGFRKFGSVWYVAYVTGLREGDAGTAPTGPLPAVDDVDIGLLNAILVENEKSAPVSEEYATGIVEAIRIAGVVKGRNTATLKIEMNETHEEGYGDVILVTKDIGGKPYWFIARFTKTVAQ